MQYSTRIRWWLLLAVRLHLLVVVSVVSLALLGREPDSVGGWEISPPTVYAVGGEGRPRCRLKTGTTAGGLEWRRSWHYLGLTWPLLLWRGGLLGVAWPVSGGGFPLWLVGLPGVVWASRVLAMSWPWLGRQPERVGWRRAGWSAGPCDWRRRG